MKERPRLYESLISWINKYNDLKETHYKIALLRGSWVVQYTNFKNIVTLIKSVH